MATSVSKSTVSINICSVKYQPKLTAHHHHHQALEKFWGKKSQEENFGDPPSFCKQMLIKEVAHLNFVLGVWLQPRHVECSHLKHHHHYHCPQTLKAVIIFFIINPQEGKDKDDNCDEEIKPTSGFPVLKRKG